MNKKFLFRDIVLAYFITGIIEFAARLVFGIPTPLTFLFAVFIVFLYLNISGKTVNLRNWWCLFLPFIFYVGVLLICMASGFTVDNIEIWMHWFAIGSIIIASIYLLPVLVGLQKATYFGDDRLKMFLVYGVFLFQLMASVARFAIFLQIEATDNIHLNRLEKYSFQSFLLIVILLNLFYLTCARRKKDESVTESVNMKKYKSIIIDLFEKKKIYLLPNLSLNTLSLESKIEKKDLETFFEQYIAMDFQSFVAEYRISYALELIKEKGTDYTLEFIATECGYRNRATFSRCFKNIVGMLPSEYLRMNNKIN